MFLLVFFGIHDDYIGVELHDALDVWILGAANFCFIAHFGLRHCAKRGDANNLFPQPEVIQGFRGGGNQADDSHGWAASAPSCFCKSSMPSTNRGPWCVIEFQSSAF